MAMLLGGGSLHSTPARGRAHAGRSGRSGPSAHAPGVAKMQDGGRRHRYSGFTGMQMSHSKTPVSES